MSNADASTSDPETTQINLRLTQAFLDDIDAVWREEGFRNRSDFIRWALRDAVRHPDFTRESWMDMAVSEHRMRKGTARTMTAEEAHELVERAADDEDSAE